MLKKDRKYYSAQLWLIQLILGISLVFADDSISIEFGEVDPINQIVPILYNSTTDVTGFQFFIIGMDVINIFGGTAEEYGFYLHQGSTCWRDNECKDVLTGFSNSDSPLPPGSGVLFYLNYAEVGDELFDLIMHIINNHKDVESKIIEMQKISYQNTWNNINQKLLSVINEN